MPLIPKRKSLTRIAGGKMRCVCFASGAGKTQLYISHKTNIGQGLVSDLESGRRKGTTAALKNRGCAQGSA